MFDFWNKLPRWLRDSVSVTVLMAILLIAYDLLMPLLTHQPYSITAVMSFPFQVIVAFVVVALYNRHKTQSQEKERRAKQAKLEEEARRAELKKQQQAHQHQVNEKRNQVAAQKQHRTK
ncbi:hypothetical protein [Secundilactobacillus kimchicus]|nr:hypothetical protein [Secundilactobacillus kimchicus]